MYDMCFTILKLLYALLHHIILIYTMIYVLCIHLHALYTGDVLKIQSMLKICSEHLTENADHQTVAVLGMYALYVWLDY